MSADGTSTGRLEWEYVEQIRPEPSGNIPVIHYAAKQPHLLGSQ